ncbi:MAG: hypothetical protein DI598_12490 [Pseudopedobacter saltans]|uniref:DUF4349 domain-containing protein n=1 Tax=Pseudopedobacter saltans TaxID=151895 RepID=A0A2W5GK58_9SPHI|nr:MAG: hypothetical protein DI598_12490 [Pseudopedobacter saltans]
MKKIIIPAIVLIGLLSSCGQQNAKESANADSTSTIDAELSSTAKANSDVLLDSSRQYVQTADIRMQVRKLQETKEKIRQIVRQQKGFILSSELENNISEQKTVAISNDSAMQVTKLSVGNSYSLKIPARNIDTTIFLLEQLGVNIDNSSRKAEDITMQWLQNSYLNNDNTIDDLKKVKASNQAGIDKVMTMHELRKQQRDANAENQELAYNIRYCDLNLNIYEAPLVKTLTIANTDKFTAYKTPFGYELKNALSQGVELFKTIIVGIAHLWLLILAAIVIFFGWKTFRKRRQSVKI